MEIKILSWNIWCDGYFDIVSKFLKDQNADVVCLQEVMDDDKSRDIITYLKDLGYECVFAPALKMPDGRSMSNTIFSKFKILNTETYVLSAHHSRNAIKADIKINDQTIHVFSTHLRHEHQKPSAVQELQAENLVKVIPANKAIVAGDFNAIPDSAAIKMMRNVMIDTDPESKPTWSVYPEGCPTCNPQAIDTRLDYIFTSKDIKYNSFTVYDSKGSDHLPVSTIVEI